MGPAEQPKLEEPNRLAKEVFDEIKYGGINRHERRKQQAIERKLIRK